MGSWKQRSRYNCPKQFDRIFCVQCVFLSLGLRQRYYSLMSQAGVQDKKRGQITIHGYRSVLDSDEYHLDWRGWWFAARSCTGLTTGWVRHPPRICMGFLGWGRGFKLVEAVREKHDLAKGWVVHWRASERSSSLRGVIERGTSSQSIHSRVRLRFTCGFQIWEALETI